MAHDLEIRNGEASMFYVGKATWHKLATQLDKPATAAEAIRADKPATRTLLAMTTVLILSATAMGQPANTPRKPTTGWLADFAAEQERLSRSPRPPTSGWLADLADEESSRRSRLRNLASAYIKGELEKSADMSAGVDWRNIPNVPEKERAEFLEVLEDVRATDPVLQRGFGRQMAEGVAQGLDRMGSAVTGTLAEAGVPGSDRDYERFARATRGMGYDARSRDLHDLPQASVDGFTRRMLTDAAEMTPLIVAIGAVVWIFLIRKRRR